MARCKGFRIGEVLLSLQNCSFLNLRFTITSICTYILIDSQRFTQQSKSPLLSQPKAYYNPKKITVCTWKNAIPKRKQHLFQPSMFRCKSVETTMHGFIFQKLQKTPQLPRFMKGTNPQSPWLEALKNFITRSSTLGSIKQRYWIAGQTVSIGRIKQD